MSLYFICCSIFSFLSNIKFKFTLKFSTLSFQISSEMYLWCEFSSVKKNSLLIVYIPCVRGREEKWREVKAWKFFHLFLLPLDERAKSEKKWNRNRAYPTMKWIVTYTKKGPSMYKFTWPAKAFHIKHVMKNINVRSWLTCSMPQPGHKFSFNLGSRTACD